MAMKQLTSVEMNRATVPSPYILEELCRKGDKDTCVAWVKGHKGIRGNEEADKLCREASILGHESEGVLYCIVLYLSSACYGLYTEVDNNNSSYTAMVEPPLDRSIKRNSKTGLINLEGTVYDGDAAQDREADHVSHCLFLTAPPAPQSAT